MPSSNFAEHETGITDWRNKDNDTSTYVNCNKKNINYCNLYVDGYWWDRVHQCTVNGSAHLTATGEFQIYNTVWELHGKETGSYSQVPARLGAWRTSGTVYGDGYVTGAWSPDVILYWPYPVINEGYWS